MTTACSIAGCERSHYAKGLCNSHWARSRRGHDLTRSFDRREWPWEARLWKRVAKGDSDQCWLWTGSTTKGYGAFSIAARQTYAHRAAFIVAHGHIPDGHFVCHRCDTPLCCNPAHLFAGTHAENMADRDAKNRKPIGERVFNAKLKERDIPGIRARLAAGERHEDIAADFNVNRATISMISSGSTWRHAP